MNSNTYSILNFVTNYILTPSINIYDSTVEYFKNLFSNNETEYIEVNVETKRIILGFTHNDINYKITSHIFQNNLKQIYEKIKEDLENNTFELKQFLGASINDEYDITEIINEYAGPFGDFYQRYGMKTSIKSIEGKNDLRDRIKSIHIGWQNMSTYSKCEYINRAIERNKKV